MPTPEREIMSHREVDRINASVMRMRRMIRDRIDARAIELGVLEIVRRPTELHSLVEHTVRGFALHERERIEISCEMPLCVLGDAPRLSRAVARLVQLGLSTSSQGSNLHIDLRREGVRAIATFGVAGTVAATKLRLALDPATAATIGDACERLGLYVAHHAIAAHGGRLTVIERPDRVTSLRVELPTLVPPAATERKTSSASVLIVDDNEEQLRALVMLLGARGHVTAHATSGSAALDQIASHPPDVLVVDARMPNLGGPELIERAREQVPELTVILMSGYPAEHPLVADVIANAGAAYVAKPIDLPTLYSEIEKAVQRRASMQYARRPS